MKKPRLEDFRDDLSQEYDFYAYDMAYEQWHDTEYEGVPSLSERWCIEIPEKAIEIGQSLFDLIAALTGA